MLELLRNADVFAPERLGRAHILVASGKVVWVGKDAPSLPAAYACKERDLDGRRVIPGLIDAHVHVTGGGGEAGARTRVPPVPLRHFTVAGVTTVVGLLGTDDTTRSTASLLARVRALVQEGISAYCHTGGYHLPPTTLTGQIRDDITHVDRILGVGEIALSDHRSSQPTLDELLRVAADAHVAGLLTGKAGIVHLHMGDGLRGLELVREALENTEIPARVWNPTHVNRRRALFEEACELAKQGCTIDVTAYPVAQGEDAWSAQEAFARYHDQGLPVDRITISSDAGGSLPTFDDEGQMTHMEVGDSAGLAATIRDLVGAGRPLESVLPAFTSNVARLLRLPDKGRIVPGADADLAVLDADGRITDVMARGRWHVEQGRAVIRGTFEAPDR